VKSTITGPDGSFSTTLKLEEEKTYEISARYRFLDREFYAESVEVTAYIPLYQKPWFVITIVVVAALIATLLIWRKRRVPSKSKH